ncbi:unnamed protein product [Rotaria magnacalcarata]|uniref:UPAR/Ly6 domain-containing protein n=2 Tax=Rotaria magnacalcarata TaxID=392030 RepID=A0A815GVB1_9BILA|nr:unnamed protein product [Rotaria magnacalcarata]CAF1580036.1 unnamed protein product [Rotaria magnacalcarata]CAF3988827.1 unnamed protein product [Rotaria magnacalcarata]
MIIAIVLLVALCIDFGQGLTCYQHDFCNTNCPLLIETIAQCDDDQDHCWKLKTLLGTKRGCGKARCSVQIDTGALHFANVCCSGILCNLAVNMEAKTLILMLSSTMTVLRGYFV